MAFVLIRRVQGSAMVLVNFTLRSRGSPYPPQAAFAHEAVKKGIAVLKKIMCFYKLNNFRVLNVLTEHCWGYLRISSRASAWKSLTLHLSLLIWWQNFHVHRKKDLHTITLGSRHLLEDLIEDQP